MELFASPYLNIKRSFRASDSGASFNLFSYFQFRLHDPRLDDLSDATLWKTAPGAGLPCRMVAHGAVEDTSGTSADRRAPQSHPENITHFRLFRSESDFKTIVETMSMLEESGFYWGAMTVEEAHHKLKKEPVGTFLIRDSQQKNVFFTLSYRSSQGPVSVRIHFQSSRFSLKEGSKESFETLFQLLEHYSSSPKRSLLRPYRKQRVHSLQELCRKRIIETSGAQAIDQLPVNPVVKDFLRSFPYRL